MRERLENLLRRPAPPPPRPVEKFPWPVLAPAFGGMVGAWPRMYTVAVPAGNLTQVTGFNPLRQVLIIASTTPAYVGLNNTVNAPTNIGIQISSSVPPLILTEVEHKNLCKATWWAHSAAGTTITVYEA